ncbi:MAG: hypothetical protein M3Y82_06725, partial [Verrucomicrobiota bacterium]|nr:hypothetical protein [Verrucomicrobiota bacterium]
RLVISGDTLYGTAFNGGSSGAGTIFQVNTNGSGFAVVKSFAEINGAGGGPAAGLLLSGGTFYGTTESGGFGSAGTVFSLLLPGPQLTIIRAGANVILKWPAADSSYTLESTVTLGASAVWNPVSPLPVIVNGQNTVTNLISGAAKFYRLSQ